jgi:hypothetical protein
MLNGREEDIDWGRRKTSQQPDRNLLIFVCLHSNEGQFEKD